MKIKIGMGRVNIFFDNGYILSIINSFGSHTENYNNFDKYEEIISNRDITSFWESETVEIAIKNSRNNEFITQYILETDDVVETVDINKLIQIINLLNNYKTKSRKK